MRRRLFLPTRSRSVALLGMATFVLAGCASDPTGGRVLFTVTVDEVSGNDQVVPTGGAASAPLVIQVMDQNGAPRSGFIIEWKITSGGGTLSAESMTTASNGQASVTYFSGGTAADVEITATLTAGTGNTAISGTPPPPVRFKLTVEDANAPGGGDE